MMRITILASLVLMSSLCSCSGPTGDQQFSMVGPPRASFPHVSDALAAHCGSVDCHGTAPRNLRIYSVNGLRINGTTGQGSTTVEEYDATYTSVVSIDPEVLSLVLAQGGAQAERWLVISKGSGREAHKGGTAMQPGSAAYRCVRSWVANALDDPACVQSSEFLAPEPP